MMQRNPQLTAIAFLVKKFGERIAGGGFEVRVTVADMLAMSPHGTFQEVPDIDGQGVRWQYFPNNTIDAEQGSWKDVTSEDVTPKGVIENGRPVQSPETDEPPSA
jgi:hypothetical protein